MVATFLFLVLLLWFQMVYLSHAFLLPPALPGTSFLAYTESCVVSPWISQTCFTRCHLLRWELSCSPSANTAGMLLSCAATSKRRAFIELE
jgi:hypothetical protein